MKRYTILATFALIAVCLLTGSVASAKPAGDSSFLTEFADNPSQVVDQMQANRLIALRYARVFVLEPKAVLTYFRNELTLITLEEDTQVQSYRLDADGRIVSGEKTLKAGTKVFANRSGLPVLEYGSGNPLTSNLTGAPKPKQKPITEAQNTPAETPKKAPAQVTKPAPASPSVEPQTQALAQATPPVAPSAPLVPTEPGSTVVASNPAPLTPVLEPTTAVKGVQMSSGGPSIGSWLVPVGLAGAVAAMAGGGGGGGTIPTGSDLPIVPEPTSLMALGAGLMGLGGLVSRRHRK